jgi:hypothetical protein
LLGAWFILTIGLEDPYTVQHEQTLRTCGSIVVMLHTSGLHYNNTDTFLCYCIMGGCCTSIVQDYFLYALFKTTFYMQALKAAIAAGSFIEYRSVDQVPSHSAASSVASSSTGVESKANDAQAGRVEALSDIKESSHVLVGRIY